MYINSLIIKVAELCNLNCSYCYLYNHEDKSYLNRPKFISPEIFETLLFRAKEYVKEDTDQKINLIFHGGEPCLIGIKRLENFIVLSKKILGEKLNKLSMQTNGTLLDETWVKMLTEHKVNVGVSIDGDKEIHNQHRVDHSGKGSFENVLRGIKLLQKSPVFNGIICVINPGVSGLKTYQFFRSNGINKISYLLPDVSHDNKEKIYGQYGSTPVADYLIPIFDKWFDENDPSVKVAPFWNLIRLIMGGKTDSDSFGGLGLNYVIIETSGEIQPVDTLRVCRENLIDTNLFVQNTSFADIPASSLLGRLFRNDIPLSETCLQCSDLSICGGGYIPHRYSRENDFQNPSVWCRDIQKILRHIKNRTNLFSLQ